MGEGYKRESEEDHWNQMVPLIHMGSARQFLRTTWFKKWIPIYIYFSVRDGERGEMPL